MSSGDILREMHALKVQPSRNMAIQGSHTFNSLFTGHGLTDEHQFMIDPVAIPEGTPVFAAIHQEARPRAHRLEGVQEWYGAAVVSAVGQAGIILSETQQVDRDLLVAHWQESTGCLTTACVGRRSAAAETLDE